MSYQEQQNDTKKPSKLIPYLKKNGFSIFMAGLLLLVMFNSDAKAWVLRQMALTGFFNAGLDKEAKSIQSGDFHFEDANGNKQNLSNLKEKVVFINFWASWCPPCKTEFPSIQALYEDFEQNNDIAFLFINQDKEFIIGENYLKENGFSFPNYKAISNIPDELFSGSLPTTVILDKKGKMRMKHKGFANYNTRKFKDQLNLLINE